MEQYRLYKYLNKSWEKTSYVGNKDLIYKIYKNLSRSNIYLFEIKKEE